jgi:hypothetical protein
VKTSVWVQIRIRTYRKAWIHIRDKKHQDPQNYFFQLRKNEVGKCSVVDPDANADLCGINFNQNVKKTTLFSKKFQYTVQNTKTYGNYDTDEKEKTMNFNPALL